MCRLMEDLNELLKNGNRERKTKLFKYIQKTNSDVCNVNLTTKKLRQIYPIYTKKQIWRCIKFKND